MRPQPPQSGPVVPAWLPLAAFVPLYLGCVLLGYRFYLTADSISAFWAAPGVGTATLLVSPWKWWPAVLGASLGCDFLAAALVGSTGLVGFVDFSATLEMLLAATLLRWWCRPHLDVTTLRHALIFVLVGCGLAPMTSALVGAHSFLHYQPHVRYRDAWQVWWFADGLGTLVAAPFLLSWSLLPARIRPGKVVEALVALGLVALVSSLVFGSAARRFESLLDFPHVIFPLLVWVAFRLDLRAVATACVVVALLAVGFADAGRGPFQLIRSASVQANVLAIQCFLAMALLSTLFLHAAVQDRERSRAAERASLQRVADLQRLELVGRIAAGLGHDFNNNLMIIGAELDLIEEAGGLEDSGRSLERIRAAVRQSSTFTERLLAMGKRPSLQPRRIPLRPFLGSLPELLRPALGSPITLELHGSSAASVELDPSQLEQVFLNLALNARDAMPTGGRLRVTIRDVELGADTPRSHPGLQAGPHVCFQVEDTGTGIARADLPHVFEPFFSTRPGGSGIGLASVYAILRQAGGTIEVDSAEGQGACFTFYLPAVA